MATQKPLPIPYSTPITGNSGLITIPWQNWFRQILGSSSSSGLTNPMTSLGDLIFGGLSGYPTRLPGNISTIKKFLVEVGDGTISSDPTWGFIDGEDLADVNVDAMSSGSATLGQVPTANGTSGITWVTPPTGSLSVSGTRSFPILITAAGGVTSTINPRQLIRVAGNGAAITISANPAISSGTIDGQELILEGCDSTDTLTINNGSGTEQASSSSMTLGRGDKIAYIWNAGASLWTEEWRFFAGLTAGIFTDASGNPFTDASGNPFTNG